MRAGETLVLIGLLGAAGPALAEAPERRFHVGIDVGRAQLNRASPGLSSGPGSNRESGAWKLRFGRRLSDSWSIEAGYTDFGRFDAAQMYAVPNAGGALAPGDYRTTARGIDLSALYRRPVGEHMFVEASAGLQRREMQTRFEPVLPGAPRFRARDGDLAVQLGAGLGFRIGADLELGVHWADGSRLDGDSEYRENHADPAMLSLGVRFRL